MKKRLSASCSGCDMVKVAHRNPLELLFFNVNPALEAERGVIVEDLQPLSGKGVAEEV